MRIVIIILLLVSFSSVYSEQKNERWRSLTPLRSTRQDVVNLLGHSSNACDCIYDLGDEILSVVYSSGGPCEHGIQGWNVKPNTVLAILVTPKKQQSLGEWGIDAGSYAATEDPFSPGKLYYSNEKDGVTISVLNGLVTRFEYGPKQNDRSLRCPGPSAVATSENGLPSYPLGRLDVYGNLSLDEEKSRLDVLAAELWRKPETRGYIIVYAGRRARVSEARIRADRAKLYLTSNYGIESSRIIAADGGFRNELTVELWFGSRTAPAPVPSPTVRPSQVKIIK
jgi:hypothetical protein